MWRVLNTNVWKMPTQLIIIWELTKKWTSLPDMGQSSAATTPLWSVLYCRSCLTGSCASRQYCIVFIVLLYSVYCATLQCLLFYCAVLIVLKLRVTLIREEAAFSATWPGVVFSDSTYGQVRLTGGWLLSCTSFRVTQTQWHVTETGSKFRFVPHVTAGLGVNLPYTKKCLDCFISISCMSHTAAVPLPCHQQPWSQKLNQSKSCWLCSLHSSYHCPVQSTFSALAFKAFWASLRWRRTKKM